MNTQLKTFNFNNSPIRIEIKNNEPLFCLKDVLPILGLENRAVSKFNFNPKGVEQYSTPTNGGKQELTFINEPNLYRVIFKSRKAEAVKFQDWIFEEVIPQIRKTGQYNLAQSEKPQKLTKEHQLFLKDLVMDRTKRLPKDKQAKGAIAQWSALKTHFGMSYKEITDDRFVEAVSLLVRLPLEGELIDKPQQSNLDQHLPTLQTSEEALAIMIRLYHYCYQAHEMQEKLWEAGLAMQINNAIGGHYLHNLKHPLEDAMTQAKKYIQENTQRVSLIKAMNNLLN